MQRTLKRAVEVAGIGLHLGEKAHIVLHPAPANTGVVFHERGNRSRSVVARHSNVKKDTVGFCTRLQDPSSGYSIATVEHLLAAISASGITNVVVDVAGPEIPILDGSSQGFLEAIASSGAIEQDNPQQVLYIRQPVKVVKENKAAYLLPRPTQELTLSTEVDFTHKNLPRQWISLALSEFQSKVGSARTFTFEDEVALLQAHGLAKGGGLHNAVVLDKNGKPINSEGLRFEDEWVRHKALDVVGDLALAGHPIAGHYVGICPGHALTHELLDALFANPANYSIE
ncbi:hypothetical protein LEN26_002185 [Aphanomyces euteiches]|nr:hypothetical protein AeMF1_017132 [Aphanomyces euteiches]KAH9159730.1 hypothetical protein LEN26_002185 [Aphanomyces euteiches]